MNIRYISIYLGILMFFNKDYNFLKKDPNLLIFLNILQLLDIQIALKALLLNITMNKHFLNKIFG